jgi:hypothetical protein
MNSPRVTQLIPVEKVERLIRLARGEKVLLDADLAGLYGVETRALNQAVRRNLNRFPSDFMFQLTREEADVLRSRSHSVTLNKRGKNIKYLPYAFTEQGVAMLSSVLRSERSAASRTCTAEPRMFRTIESDCTPKKGLALRFLWTLFCICRLNRVAKHTENQLFALKVRIST